MGRATRRQEDAETDGKRRVILRNLNMSLVTKLKNAGKRASFVVCL